MGGYDRARVNIGAEDRLDRDRAQLQCLAVPDYGRVPAGAATFSVLKVGRSCCFVVTYLHSSIRIPRPNRKSVTNQVV